MKDRLLEDMIGWDVRNWSKGIPLWDRYWPGGPNKKGLELGARDGGLSLWMAGKGMEVVCSDLDCPKERALPVHQRHGVSERISYAAIDATNIGYENHFDVIMFKSVLGGVGKEGHSKRQRRVLSEIRKALKPGGLLFFAENLLASVAHRYFRENYVQWGKSWRYVAIGEMEDFLKDYKKFHYKTYGFLGAFGRNEAQRDLLGRIDALVDPVIPSSWKYIMFGAAQK